MSLLELEQAELSEAIGRYQEKLTELRGYL